LEKSLGAAGVSYSVLRLAATFASLASLTLLVSREGRVLTIDRITKFSCVDHKSCNRVSRASSSSRVFEVAVPASYVPVPLISLILTTES
jgi:hypothetical protein